MKVTRPPAVRSISGALFVVQLAIMVFVVAVVAGVGVVRAVNGAQATVEQRIEDLAETIRWLPAVSSGLQGDNSTAEIQPIVDAALAASNFQYISVVDLAGVRVAYVDPALVGHSVSSDHELIRQGNEFRGIETGPQGETYRVKLPIRDEGSGAVVGTISIGELVSDVRRDALNTSLPIAFASIGAIVAGAVLAWLVTRWLRRKLYGVEPEQLVSLLQAHQAVMASGHEGVVSADEAGRIQIVNAEAERLMGSPADGGSWDGQLVSALPEPVRESFEPGETGILRLKDLGGASVFLQAAEVHQGGRFVGRMVTLRDRTEVNRALDTLEAERAAGELLRIEAHEFENRMHLVSGLIELGEYAEARVYLDGLTGHRLVVGLEMPLLAALVSAHVGLAAREQVTCVVDERTWVPADWPIFDDDLMVVANLLRNAVEATGFGGQVWLLVRADEERGETCIRVDDDGTGFAQSPEEMLRSGATSKDDDLRHGIGLASVNRVVRQRGGQLSFSTSELGGGAAVEVRLPVGSERNDVKETDD